MSFDLITEFDFLTYCVRFPWNICNGCGMPTEDAYSSGHLVLFYFRTCIGFKCRDQFLLNLSCSRTFEFRTSLSISLLLSYIVISMQDSRLSVAMICPLITLTIICRLQVWRIWPTVVCSCDRTRVRSEFL